MEPGQELLREAEVEVAGVRYRLTLQREDFSAVYPGLVRFVLMASAPGRRPAVKVTNTYEYSPLLAGSAEEAARDTAGEAAAAWESRLREDPEALFREYAGEAAAPAPDIPTDILILQGSPRPDGNCSILAGWAADAARTAGRTFRVVYPHDLDIHPCIGCYQCYNSGTCVFRDDMDGIIAKVRGARLVVVCTPVYSNTVPGSLKLLIDRMQAYAAERALGSRETAGGGKAGGSGLTCAVAGRRGGSNFTCITKVLDAFYYTIGVAPAGSVLIDSADTLRDIRTLPGKEAEVTALVQRLL